MAWIKERKTKKGAIRHRAVVRRKGFSVQCATFARRTDAVRWAKQIEIAMDEGRHFKSSEDKKHTLKELIERYEKEYLPRKVKAKQEAHLKWWKEKIGHHLLSEITRFLIVEYSDKLLQGWTIRNKRRSPSTVVRYLAALSHVFTIAVKDWGWVQENPVLKIRKPSEPRGRVRFLNDDERVCLLDACKASSNTYLYVVVVVALSTGMRQGEIMNLKWKDVYLERGQIILLETKNNERRVVPLKGHALEVLKRFHQERKVLYSLLFPGENKDKPIDIRSSWNYAVRRADIKDFRFHDLRHSTASYLAMNGNSLAEIAAVLGHKTLAMVKRYAHLSEAHTADIVERMNEQIFG